MNDDFLYTLRKEPRAQFAMALYRRINGPTNLQTRHNWPSFAAATGALAVMFATALLLSPSARAFAEGILRQVGGYVFVLGGQPVNFRGGSGPIRVVKTLGSVSMETVGSVPAANDLTEASRMAGFRVLVPAYLPAGYSAMSGWFITSDNGGKVATNGYRDATNHFLIVNQWQVGAGASREFAKDQIVDITVRGRAGLWLPDASGGPTQKNALVWDEAGITYSLITDSLDLDEMLKVADSLGR